MNEVFLMGKVITGIEFKIIIHSKRISRVKFKVKILEDNEIISIVAYDELADYIYRNINIADIVTVNGYIEGNNVIVKDIYLFI